MSSLLQNISKFTRKTWKDLMNKEINCYLDKNNTKIYARIFLLVIICIFISCVTACQKPEKKRFEAEFLTLFDTVTQIVAYMDSKEEFSEHVNQIYQDLEAYHQLYDIYNSYEDIINIKIINDSTGEELSEIDSRIIDLLLFAKDIYQQTNGKVNIAMGSVLSIWHEYRERGIQDPENAELPQMDLLEVAARHTDINKLVFNKVDSTVCLKDPEMSLDVGAIAKGYAVEQVSRKAIKRGFTSGLISVGGNVKIIGSKDSKGEPWNIGIQNPESPGVESNLHIANLSDQSLVTSGNYIRYYTVNGKKYHHIIDPDTLYPADYFTAVTVVCEDSGEADALATAIYNMHLEKGLALIEGKPGIDAFWVLPDGEQKFTTGFHELLAKSVRN